MTQDSKDRWNQAGVMALKSYLPLGIALVTCGTLYGAMRGELDSNAKADQMHHHDPSLHMPYEAKIKSFVTRTEWELMLQSFADNDRRQREILDALARLEAKISTVHPDP